jgi:tetratricopeptide (TPR) repeat protein
MSDIEGQVSAFLKDSTIFVIDKSSVSRRRFCTLLTEIAANKLNIHQLTSLEEAEKLLQNVQPKMVFSDFQVGNESALDFFQKVRTQYDNDETTFVLVTSNISQSAVAKAAEEEVDSFIVKPFKKETIKEAIVKLVEQKVNPNEYQKAIRDGKKLLEQGEFEEAMNLFEQAKFLDDTPTLAHYYYGQAKNMLNVNNEAEKSFQDGLGINNMHFKCQLGLYNLFMKEEKLQKAYDVLKNITYYFSPNPDRLISLVRLAVSTENFSDIPGFIDTYMKLDRQDREVTKHLCAGLFVAGKSLLAQGNTSQALNVFDKLVELSFHEKKFLWGVIQALIDYEAFSGIAKYIGYFKPEDAHSMEYQLSQYFMLHNLDEPLKVIELGSELSKHKMTHYFMHKMMIKAYLKQGDVDAAEKWAEQASGECPDKKNGFQRIIYDFKHAKAA